MRLELTTSALATLRTTAVLQPPAGAGLCATFTLYARAIEGWPTYLDSNQVLPEKVPDGI